MSIMSAMYSELKNTTSITTFVNDRIFTLVAPTDTAFPYLVLNRVSEFRANPLSGIVRTDLDINAYGQSPDIVISITDALYMKLHNFRGFLGDEQLDTNWIAVQSTDEDEFKPAVGEDVWTFRSKVDVAVWHQQVVPYT